jgi:hypothetical protein
MINVRNLYLIYPDVNHVTEKTIQSYGHKEKLLNIKYVTDNQRTCGALWYIGWWHMLPIGNYIHKNLPTFQNH